MKIEISTLDENLLLTFLTDRVIKRRAAALYAVGVINKIIAQIEAEKQRTKPK